MDFSRPVRFDLMDLGCPTLFVALPIEGNVSPDRDSFIAKTTQTDATGKGENPGDAVDELRKAVVVLYERLSGISHHRLTAKESMTKEYLESHIKRKGTKWERPVSTPLI